ncbi:MAG: mercury methylation ferredoxin HgcB [Fibrobacterota bacterium]
MDGFRYLSGVTTLVLDSEKCTGCGMCEKVCPHAVFRIESRKAVLMDRDACMECGACARNCPESALSVRAGVGCAAGVILGWLRGTEASCDCGPKGGSSCCG